jgi:ParB-like chromosome segregation protein Spo0J
VSADDATMSAGIHRLHPGELRESAINPRTISDDRFAALKYAMEQDPGMMEARPIIATLDGEVVAGNMRLRAARDLGWDSVPVFLADLDERRKREWMLRDNQGYGEWEQDALTALVREYANDLDGDTRLLGFADDDLDALLAASADSGGLGAGIDPEPPAMFGVVVECESEQQQADLLERLEDEGFTVRALL